MTDIQRGTPIGVEDESLFEVDRCSAASPSGGIVPAAVPSSVGTEERLAVEDGDPEGPPVSAIHRRRWHWLLTPDGSYETARGPRSSIRRRFAAQRNGGNGNAGGDGVPIDDSKRRVLLPPVEARGGCDCLATAADIKTDPVKPKLKPVELSWHWLLNPDGSYATIDSRTGSARTTTRRRTRAAAERTEEKRKQRDPVEAGSENEGKEGSNRNSWHWLLVPDGGYATVETTKARETIESEPDAEGSKDAKRKRNAGQRDKSWYWLLAPDGTPATIQRDFAATSANPTDRKRMRIALRSPPKKQSASKGCSSRRHRTDSKAEEEGDSCDTNDRDFFENHRKADIFTQEQHEKWERNFQLLVDYKTKFRTTEVPQDHSALGGWVKSQRRVYKVGKMTKYRLQRLESIGFVWEICETGWMKMYQWLLSYREQHDGSINVPQSIIPSNEYRKLACWTQNQRLRFSCGRMSDKRRSLLESIGFRFHKVRKDRNENANQKSWMKMYRRLLAYKDKHKSACVPRCFKADRKLANWVHRQRSFCVEKPRIDLLNYIGFVWNPLEDDWMEMYNRLLAYQKKYESTRIPRHFEADPKLGHWVKGQRANCKRKDRVDLLNAIGFVWNARVK